MIYYKKTNRPDPRHTRTSFQSFKTGGNILLGVKKIPSSMKETISPYIIKSSKYHGKNGIITGLRKPLNMDSDARGLGFGADKDGFFVHTHRARSKSYPTPFKIPKDKIKFIKSTG